MVETGTGAKGNQPRIILPITYVSARVTTGWVAPCTMFSVTILPSPTIFLMNSSRFEEITSRYSELRVAVVGDYSCDRYLEIDPSKEENSMEPI